MKQQIHLLGGVDILRSEVSPLDIPWIRAAGNAPICVVDLTGTKLRARREYRNAMRLYFSHVTKNKLLFVSELPSHSAIVSAFGSAGAVYIPGGDTERLLSELKRLDLAPLFGAVACPIAGNSAGAVALCREAVLTTDQTVSAPTVRPGLGFVDFSVDPHYGPSHEPQLVALSEHRVIYGLTEESAIVVDGGSTRFAGPVWRFSGGQSEKVN